MMMRKILVEFFSTCPGWSRAERQVVALAKSPKWQGKVDLKIYYLQHDPTPALKYEPIMGATVVVGQRVKITDVTEEKVTRALEQAVQELERVWWTCSR
jgi:hypothetical protein